MSSPPAEPPAPAPAPREGSETAVRYAAALILYIAIGYFTKSAVLNWIVGPLFPLLVLYLLPRASDLVRGRRDPRP